MTFILFTLSQLSVHILQRGCFGLSVVFNMAVGQVSTGCPEELGMLQEVFRDRSAGALSNLV